LHKYIINNISECSTTESIWACLSCGHMGCGRFVQEHAQHHAVKSNVRIHEFYLIFIFNLIHFLLAIQHKFKKKN